TIRSRISAPIAAVFGNNEYANDHPMYVARFGAAHHVRFLQDEAERWSVGGREVRVIGSLGCLDRPTWWQRKNLPHLAEEYRRRIIVGGPLADDGMAHEPRRDRDEDDRPTSFWKGLARDALVAGLIVAVFLGALYLYAGVWPPLVVVESSSMQHGNEASSLGV